MKAATFGFETPNLGDDLQAVAAAAFLPFVDTLVDRDEMGRIDLPEQHAVLMNCWFQLKRSYIRHVPKPFIAPSSSFSPIFYGFSMTNENVLTRSWRDYLEKHQPIGCRDIATAERLSKLSIQAHWTGCITRQLGRTLQPVGAETRSGIYFVDIPDEVERAFIPAHLREEAIRLGNYTPERFTRDPLERMHYLGRQYDLLRRAELVVTRRLHVLLPCLGFGTPVVAIVERTASTAHRFSGYDAHLPITFHGGDLRPKPIDWDDRSPPAMPAEHDRHFADLLANLQHRLGAVNSTRAGAIAACSRLTIPNPGLGSAPGELAIELGTHRVVRQPHHWSDREIVLDLAHFAGFERFKTPLLARGYGRGEWIELGPIGPILMAATPVPLHAPSPGRE